MAEVTGLRNNALNYPVYGAPYGLTYPILDADGDLVTGATGLDAEISKNGDTFADCTNEGTEIATASGMYYLLLTATELTTDVATIIQKTSTSGAKTTPMVLYPRKLVTIRSGTSASGGSSTSTIVLDGSASALDDYYNGMLCVATIDSNVEARIITDYTGSNQTATVVPDWNVAPDNNDTFIVYLPEGAQVPTANTIAWLNTTVATPATAGIPDVNAKNWNNLTTVALPLVPTTAGRTLDVSTTGEAGVDWANVGSPTTTVGLTGTTISTAQVVASVTGAVGSVTGAVGSVTGNVGGNVTGSVGSVVGAVGSVTGAVGSVTGNVGGNVVGSVGSVVGAVGSVTGAVGSVTGNVGGNVVGTVASVVGNVGGDVVGDVQGNVLGSVASVATAGITAGSFAAGAIDNAAIASNAIGAAEIATGAITAAKFAASAIDAAALATDAVNEIRDAIFARAFSAAYGSLTFDQVMSVILATQAAKTSGGATTTFTIRNLADGADVIVATVDASGNRTAVTVTP